MLSFIVPTACLSPQNGICWRWAVWAALAAWDWFCERRDFRTFISKNRKDIGKAGSLQIMQTFRYVIVKTSRLGVLEERPEQGNGVAPSFWYHCLYFKRFLLSNSFKVHSGKPLKHLIRWPPLFNGYLKLLILVFHCQGWVYCLDQH